MSTVASVLRPQHNCCFSRVSMHETNVGMHETNVGMHKTNVGMHETNVGMHETNVGMHETNSREFKLWYVFIAAVSSCDGVDPYVPSAKFLFA